MTEFIRNTLVLAVAFVAAALFVIVMVTYA